MYILSVNLAGHDSSICLLKNGKIQLFVSEERISKIKHDSSFPLVCLDLISDYTNKIDYFIVSNCMENCDNYPELIVNYLYKRGVKINDNERYVINSEHHLFHAYCGYYFSKFKDCSFLILDGWGSSIEIEENIFGLETCSIFNLEDLQFNLNYKNIFCKEKVKNSKKYNISDSIDIGVMYSSASSYLKMGEHGEGKVMGLSTYGKNDPTIPNLLKENYEIDMNFFNSDFSMNIENIESEENLAFTVQKEFEKKILIYVQKCIESSTTNNLILSGGCALNVVANTLIKKTYPHINLFVDPIPDDAGQSIGAALFLNHRITGNLTSRNSTVYLGPNYTINTLKDEIEKNINDYRK